MNYVGESFRDQRLELHGKSFSGCTFIHCQLVYDGDRSPTFSNNTFIDTQFIFTGAALRNLYFLGNMYHAGDGGKDVIDRTFADIKQGAVHGHELATRAPHSLGPVAN